MAASLELCEYCALIEFDRLNHPTAADFMALELGDGAPGLPYARAEGKYYVTCALGVRSRIEQSSLSCRLCHAICELLRQDARASGIASDDLCFAHIDNSLVLHPRDGASWEGLTSQYMTLQRLSLHWRPVRDGESVLPGPSSDDALQNHLHDQVKMIDCFQTCIPGAPLAAIESLFNVDALPPEQLVFGGRRRPRMLDLRLPARWLDECLAKHGGACGPIQYPSQADIKGDDDSMSTFRLIDVEARTVVQFHDIGISGLKYTTVSYVWGGPLRLMLLRSNAAELHKPGALDSELLPRTIRDAMDFTRSLKIRYLWADAICIVQDDQEDQRLQISNMSSIYLRAMLVIVAADGRNADAGLPGLHQPRDAEQVEVTLPHTGSGAPKSILTSLTPRREMFLPAVSDNVWATRGWTLQEHMLARRSVIFMDQKIMWECGSSRWSEETQMEPALAIQKWIGMTMALVPSLPSLHVDMNSCDPYTTLRALIMDFQLRKLTNPGDAYDAFSALLRHLERRNGEVFLWGMPTLEFGSALCWETNHYSLAARRTCLTTHEMTSLKRRVPFPTWTWMGWEGIVHLFQRDSSNSSPALDYYVLRNTPLRLEHIAPAAGPAPPAPLSLDDVASCHPDLAVSALRSVPDDQYICFRAEYLSFSDVDGVELDGCKAAPAGTKFFRSSGAAFLASEWVRSATPGGRDPVTRLPFPERRHKVFVADEDGHRLVGHTKPCPLPGAEDDAAWSTPLELVMLMDKSYSDGEVFLLEIKTSMGVSRRLNTASVAKEAWNGSKVNERLVVLN